MGMHCHGARGGAFVLSPCGAASYTGPELISTWRPLGTNQAYDCRHVVGSFEAALVQDQYHTPNRSQHEANDHGALGYAIIRLSSLVSPYTTLGFARNASKCVKRHHMFSLSHGVHADVFSVT
ncbi:uncharacterized protein UV8b_04516 [Ustilaginoidea virens]|uniref:Uncharacterized protein n=1 Tax=Ustilaginoidea virens TaxID=1159556 RepID=A0A8E5HRE7_USTVR|nr:uncharacterized protein UV8b_04516 [Ustilaginoidea virens]QUC20275.1 hypothetical protein UV8b_04516 [Ustilaginoidea virens]